MKANDLIRFRCTKEQRKAFESRAQSSGLTLSAWIISKCEGEHVVATKPKPVATQAPIVPTKEFVCLLKAK